MNTDMPDKVGVFRCKSSTSDFQPQILKMPRWYSELDL